MAKKPMPPEKWAKRVEDCVFRTYEASFYNRDYIDLGGLKRRGMRVSDVISDARSSY